MTGPSTCGGHILLGSLLDWSSSHRVPPSSISIPDHERHYGQGCDDACNDVGRLPHLPLLHRSEETEYQCAAIKIIGAWEVRLKKDPRSLTLGVQDIRQEHGGSEVYCHLHLTVRPDIVSALFWRTTIMDRSYNGKHPAGHDIDCCCYSIPIKISLRVIKNEQ